MATCLTLIALLAAAGGPSAEERVRQLGSERFAERVEAVRALEAMGPDALPALRAAKDALDPRIRSRVGELLAAIETTVAGEPFARGVLVRLDFRDRPLGEIIDTLNARDRLGLALEVDPRPGDQAIVAIPSGAGRKAEVRARPLTLEAPAPVPFWEAIDRLCRAGNLQHDLSPDSRFGPLTGMFRLFPDRSGTAIVSDDGPIRVKVTGLHASRERAFIAEPSAPEPPVSRPQPETGGTALNVRLAVIPGPGLVVRPLAQARIAEATDDCGNSLRFEHSPGEPTPRLSGPGGPPESVAGPPGFNLRLDFPLTNPRSRMIRRLRGSVPVVLVAHRPNPLVLPLKDARGKPYRNAGVTVLIHETVLPAGQDAVIEVSVRSNSPGPPDFPAPGNPRRAPFLRFRGEWALEHLELFDAEGHELAFTWTQAPMAFTDPVVTRFRLTVRPIHEGTVPGLPGFPPQADIRRPIPVELR
jgi:hypothetical protein